MSEQLAYLSIAEAARQIAAKDLSPVDLVNACLSRIEIWDGRLRSYVLVRPDAALAEARRAADDIARDRGRGPLHGIPFGLKDVYGTAGIPTTGCSQLLLDNVPSEDCSAWARLKAAGAILLGKHENAELATGGPADDGPFPTARNPWNTDRYAGGSSSGSGVAVAAGLCLGAMGTDTGGSIRVPAALCGIAGLRPTFGRVSRRGVIPLANSLDCCGPMAWTAEDGAIVLKAIAGHDPLDPASADVPVDDYTSSLTLNMKGLRIGFIRHFSHGDARASDAVNEALDAALEVFASLGARVRDVMLPSLWDFSAVFSVVGRAEAYAVHERDLMERPQLYTRFARDRLRLGAFIGAGDYVRAQKVRKRLVARYAAAFEDVDILVCAAALETADRIEDVTRTHTFVHLDVPVITAPFSVVGAPSISVCCGFDHAGLPIGMQISGRPFDEATILTAAAAYERATPWRDRRPMA